MTRRFEALAQFRDALAGYRALSLAFDEALTALDMIELLGADEPEARTAAEWTRATLTRLGATPLVLRLDAALAQPSGGSAVSAAHTKTGSRARSASATSG